MASYTNKIKTQRGIGLIEVLIAAVVVSVGLLALGSLQGGLMSSSGESKARSEAIKLAEEKLEEYRNNIIQGNYDAIVTSAANESIAGSNATFSRGWVVTDATAPNRKNISIKVTWGAAGANETVNMVSEQVWADPGRSSAYATGGNGLSGKASSPNNQSSEKTSKQFPAGTGTVLGDGSELSTHMEGDSLYLLDSTGKALIKFNGGIQLTIKGTVYLGTVDNNNGVSIAPTAAYLVTFSDLAYCKFPLPDTTADYICYFGGSCTKGGAGCLSGDHTYSAVNGGWYGKVGLIETADDNFHNKKVCFAEDIAGTGMNTLVSTAREYVTRRLDASNNAVASEGINQSFACQNFLIVDKKGSSYPCDSFSNYTYTVSNSPIKKLAVPSSSIKRVLTQLQQNVVLAEDTSSCGDTSEYIITGSITGDYASQVEVLVGHNACLTSFVSTGLWSYKCTIETVETSLAVTAEGGGVTPATQTFASLSPTMTGATLITSGSSGVPPVVDVNPSIPNPSWSTSTDPKALTWTAVASAAGYKIYTCTTTNNDNFTSCIPAVTPTATITVNSYAPSPGNKDTICVQIVATDREVDSAASGVKCIHVQGHKYSYQ